MRLSKSVSRKLGSRYAKVVRLCLAQDFENQRFVDIEVSELNAVIIKSVVKELDRCLSVMSGNKRMWDHAECQIFADLWKTSLTLPLELLTILPPACKVPVSSLPLNKTRSVSCGNAT